MNELQTAPAGWKKKIVHELIEYWINFGYLAFFLVAFAWYRRFILAEYQVQYTNYWFPLIEAAVLAKVIMIGDFLRLGHALEQKALILSTLFRTVMFSVWVAIFNVLEETVRGLLHGNGLTGGLEEGLVRITLAMRRDFCGLYSFLRVQGVGTGARPGKTPSAFLEARSPSYRQQRTEYAEVSTTVREN